MLQVPCTADEAPCKTSRPGSASQHAPGSVHCGEDSAKQHVKAVSDGAFQVQAMQCSATEDSALRHIDAVFAGANPRHRAVQWIRR